MNNQTKGIEFEKHCMNLLQQLGFTSVKQTGRSGDQGADILGTYGNTLYVFQCKDHGVKQGNWSIQEVLGSKSIYNASRAVVISRTGFTRGALHLARANYCLPLTSHELEEAIARNESFDSVISTYTFPPSLQVAHDFDAIKKYEEVKKRVGRVPKRGDFDPATLRFIERKYGGLRKLILSLSDVPFTIRPSNQSIATEYKRIRQLIGRVPTLEDMSKHSEFSRNCFHDYPLTRLQRECGDRPHKELGLDKDALRAAYNALQTELGRPPSPKDLDQKGKYRYASYARVWGTWGNFLRERGIPVVKGTPKRFTKAEFLALYVLVNKLLEILRRTPPETWTTRHALLFEGRRVINQRWSENLFGNAKQLKQALESENAQILKRALDDLIKASLSSAGDEALDERVHERKDA